jgi:hypothetical protein
MVFFIITKNPWLRGFIGNSHRCSPSKKKNRDPKLLRPCLDVAVSINYSYRTIDVQNRALET